jgi:hypothetical protein
MNYFDLDELKVAFAAHAAHCQLQFTGKPEINVIATNRGDRPIAILRPNERGRPPTTRAYPAAPAFGGYIRHGMAWRIARAPRWGLRSTSRAGV